MKWLSDILQWMAVWVDGNEEQFNLLLAKVEKARQEDYIQPSKLDLAFYGCQAAAYREIEGHDRNLLRMLENAHEGLKMPEGFFSVALSLGSPYDLACQATSVFRARNGTKTWDIAHRIMSELFVVLENLLE